MESFSDTISHNIMVCVDGSEASHQAYETVVSSLLREIDFLIIAHIYNKEKTYLPFNMKAETIKQTYESLIIGYGKRAILIWEELEPKLSTKEHVL